MNQRLFEITYLLTQKGCATAAQLAQRFGVSRRTIYRDVDALSAAGIPVYAEKGKGGGIRILPDFVLDKTHFSRDEQTQLVAHFESLAALGTPDVQPVLEKLGALFGRGDSWLQVDYAPWGDGEAARAVFRTLRAAILQHHVVAFDYIGAERAKTQRVVEPMQILFRGQGWYLQGYCRLRGAFRIFKLNRMLNLRETGERFEPRPLPQATHQTPPAPLVPVTLRLAPAAAFRAMDEFPPEVVSPQPDGSCIVKCPLPMEGDWLVGYLLSFGDAAEVLAPPELRQRLHDAVAGMARIYG